MRLLLARHAETDGNRREVYLGSRDEDLNKNGVAQAEKLALRLKDYKIDLLISSDLKRARKTAESIDKYHKLGIEICSEIRERSVGVFEGRPKIELLKAVGRSGKEFHEYKPKNGESCTEVKARVVPLLKKLIKENSDKTVLMVSHSGVILELLFYLTKLPRSEYVRLKHDRAALTIIDIGKVNKIEMLNNTDHLRHS